ncbi:MAG: STAS domain-containing protein [Bacilli bacterium]|nr:STAS domain-containing protein [Bacilli bacterium]
MNISHTREGEKLTICLNGRLDTVTAPELESFLMENLEGVTSLVFDLKEMDYTSSAGLRIFLKAQKLMSGRGEMVIENVQEDVMEVFEITGFTDFLTIR